MIRRSDAACDLIEKTGDDDPLAARKVQGFDYTGMGIAVHVVEHFLYHVGWITFRVKTMKEIDLGY